MQTRRLFVRIGATGIPVGELIVDTESGGRETSTFTYDQSWIENRDGFALAPDMPLGPTPIYTNRATQGSSLPGPIADGTPDSWGRAIIKMALGGRIESDLDYLLHSDDFLRSGALRYYYSRDAKASALAPPRDGEDRVAIPRLYDLEQIITEARSFEADPIHYRERRNKVVGGRALEQAVGSLGGARPKVNAMDDKGLLHIVKLAKGDDEYAVARAEVMALTLAARVGISASFAYVLPTSDKFPVAIVQRFDRGRGNLRIPFISAQTFMGLPGAEPGNYVDVALRMHKWSRDPKSDMQELYRRILFNVLVQSTDDHLRNLGFLYRGGGKWGLSPAFDINPVPEEGTTLKTAISEVHGNAPDVEKLVDAAPYFDVKPDEAVKIAASMAKTVRDEWKAIGGKLGMSSRDFASIAPAMENTQIGIAIGL